MYFCIRLQIENKPDQSPIQVIQIFADKKAAIIPLRILTHLKSYLFLAPRLFLLSNAFSSTQMHVK